MGTAAPIHPFVNHECSSVAHSIKIVIYWSKIINSAQISQFLWWHQKNLLNVSETNPFLSQAAKMPFQFHHIWFAWSTYSLKYGGQFWSLSGLQIENSNNDLRIYRLTIRSTKLAWLSDMLGWAEIFCNRELSTVLEHMFYSNNIFIIIIGLITLSSNQCHTCSQKRK